MRICDVEGCENVHLARGMCNAHYLKWRQNTDELTLKPCAVEGCSNPHASHGYCGTHAKHFRHSGDPIAANRKGRNHPKWAGATPTYGGAHSRVRNRYGPPSAHDCADCGDVAQEWAYDHLDLAELIFDSPKGRIAYSASPAHYMPMCKPCHTRFDRRARLLAVT